MKIKGYGTLVLRAQRETELVDFSENPMVFLRYMRQGLVVVRSYPDEKLAAVEMVRDGYRWRRWYEHSPITTRQAARLVNRFLRDMSAPPSEEESE